MAYDNLMRYTFWKFRKLKLNSVVKSLYSLRSVSSLEMSYSCESDTAYFIQEDQNSFSVSLFVEFKPYSFKKNFTFWRPLSSPLTDFLDRVDLKLNKYLTTKLRKSNVNYVIPELKTVMYRDGGPIDSEILCLSIFCEKKNYEMEVMGRMYKVVCNCPWVKNIILPELISSNMILFPCKFEYLNMDVNSSCFKWYKTNTVAAYLKRKILHENNWVEVGNDFSYVVQDSDVGHHLKFVCHPVCGEVKGPTFTVISRSPVAASRNDYNFLTTHQLTSEMVDEDHIRVVTYNILAEKYTETKEGKIMYDYCAPEVLHKWTRFITLARELSGYNADLICLQEVEKSNQIQYLTKWLNNINYGNNICLKFNCIEGTAIFFNKTKFQLLSASKFGYTSEIWSNNYLKSVLNFLKNNPDFHQKYSDIPHALQIVVLESLCKKDHVLIVANLHLISFPDADMMRLIKVISAFCLLDYTKINVLAEKPERKVGYLLCGDFNSTPDRAINKLILSGSISLDDPLWKDNGLRENKGLKFKTPVEMKSAFTDVPYTNYTKLFKGCLDYIYYESDFLELTKKYPLPDESVLNANIGLPSPSFPSDHLPLIAEFKWK